MRGIELSQEERRYARRVAGLPRGDSAPVVVVRGGQSPREAGHSYRWETLGGRPIHAPSSYSRKGWNNMRYVPSTRRVEVGAAWIGRRRARKARAVAQ